jgi:hypothetical protein
MSEAIFKRMEAAKVVKEGTRDYRIKMFLGKAIRLKPVYGDVGLELEIEGDDLPGPDHVRAGDIPVDTGFPLLTEQTARHWVATKDGSLRGDNFEYITSGPIKVAEVEPMLVGLWEQFEKAGSKLQLSNRCSTHVHLNFSMFSPKPITSMIALWSMVEEVATNWCGDQRVSNPFCLRVKDSLATVEQWTEHLEGRAPEWGQGLKYNSMNLKPLWDRGSIEFRCLRGAENPDMVIQWVKFLWALRTEAHTTYGNPMKLASDVSAMSAYGVIDRIIRDHDLLGLWTEMLAIPDNEDVPDKVRKGFLLVQPLLFGTNWDIVPEREEAGEVVETELLKAERDARAANWALAQERLKNPFADEDEEEDIDPIDREFEPEEAPRRRARAVAGMQPEPIPLHDPQWNFEQGRFEDARVMPPIPVENPAVAAALAELAGGGFGEVEDEGEN